MTDDLLFIVVTGAGEDARTEWDTLRRLFKPPPFWPGHDYGARPASNPFLRCKDFAALTA